MRASYQAGREAVRRGFEVRRWRAQAEQEGISAEGRQRLEWLIFHHTVGGGFPHLKDDSVVIKKDRVLVYLDSEDIEADLKKIEAAGGKVVHGKEEIPGWGWWAGFTDPTGNFMGLYQGMPKQ